MQALEFLHCPHDRVWHRPGYSAIYIIQKIGKQLIAVAAPVILFVQLRDEENDPNKISFFSSHFSKAWLAQDRSVFS